jgi:hypothetical protein
MISPNITTKMVEVKTAGHPLLERRSSTMVKVSFVDDIAEEERDKYPMFSTLQQP